MPALLAAALLLFSIGCRQPSSAIVVDQDFYTPAMSSTVGIGLSPAFEGGTARCHWRTDYGFFLSWGPPDYKVVNLGPETRNNGEKVYWSYDPAEMSKEKPEVELALTLEDPISGAPVSEAMLRLRWKDAGTAEVVR